MIASCWCFAWRRWLLVKYSPGKPTQNLKITLLKRKFIFQTSIFFGFHVSFRGWTLPGDESISHLGKKENHRLRACLGLGLCPFPGINIELMEDIRLKILKIYIKPVENKRNLFFFHIFNWSGISSISLIFCLISRFDMRRVEFRCSRIGTSILIVNLMASLVLGVEGSLSPTMTVLEQYVRYDIPIVVENLIHEKKCQKQGFHQFQPIKNGNSHQKYHWFMQLRTFEAHFSNFWNWFWAGFLNHQPLSLLYSNVWISIWVMNKNLQGI